MYISIALFGNCRVTNSSMWWEKLMLKSKGFLYFEHSNRIKRTKTSVQEDMQSPSILGRLMVKNRLFWWCQTG